MPKGKPHWILRTHDGVPVPPSWAKGYRLKIRWASISIQFEFDPESFLAWDWRLADDRNDIIAIMWLP